MISGSGYQLNLDLSNVAVAVADVGSHGGGLSQEHSCAPSIYHGKAKEIWPLSSPGRSSQNVDKFEGGVCTHKRADDVLLYI